MKGKWDYQTSPAPVYGPPASYHAAAEFLDDYGRIVEDWGCGAAGARPFFKNAKYIGVDGSPGFADVVDDLRTRSTSAWGILLRHVLEHNYDWAKILDLAAQSCRKLVIVFFLEPTPFTAMSMHGCNPNGVPNLHVSRILVDEILRAHGFTVSEMTILRGGVSPHTHEWILRAVKGPTTS